MKKENYSKILKRRVKWFEKGVSRSKGLKSVKKKIDEYFEEEERESAYAITADIMTMSYPFDTDRVPSGLVDVVRGKYGLDVGDAFFIMDILEEMEEEKVKEMDEDKLPAKAG